MTPNDFVLNFPEFRETDGLLVAAKLNMAATRMGGPDASVWGSFATPQAATQIGGPTPMTIADMAQGNLAAHYLVTAPFGTEMRLEPGNGRTSYLDLFEEMQEVVAGGFLVAGARC